MVQAGLDANFSDSLFATLKINQLKPIVLFNSDALTRRLMEALLYHRVRSAADLLAEMI